MLSIEAFIQEFTDGTPSKSKTRMFSKSLPYYRIVFNGFWIVNIQNFSRVKSWHVGHKSDINYEPLSGNNADDSWEMNDPGPLPPKANNPAGVTAELPMKRISFISLSEFHLDSPELFSKLLSIPFV